MAKSQTAILSDKSGLLRIGKLNRRFCHSALFNVVNYITQRKSLKYGAWWSINLKSSEN